MKEKKIERRRKKEKQRNEKREERWEEKSRKLSKARPQLTYDNSKKKLNLKIYLFVKTEFLI